MLRKSIFSTRQKISFTLAIAHFGSILTGADILVKSFRRSIAVETVHRSTMIWTPIARSSRKEYSGISAKRTDSYYRSTPDNVFWGAISHSVSSFWTGQAAGPKSSVVKVIAGVIGLENVYELRTKQLGERFEIGRMIGRTLLTGSDVQSYFLSENGAYRIKSIVGGDLLEAELKCSNERFTVHGVFNLLITSNTRLRLPLHGDRSAWQRRLTIVRYDQPFSGQRIFEIEKHLLETESAGILNWCLKGLQMLFSDYTQAGDIILSEVQKKRVEDLLSESESLALFVRENVVPDCVGPGNNGDKPHRPSLTVDEIINRYQDFCQDKGWTPAPIAEVEKQLPDLMFRFLNVRKSHDIDRDGKARRGYWNVGFIPERGDWL